MKGYFMATSYGNGIYIPKELLQEDERKALSNYSQELKGAKIGLIYSGEYYKICFINRAYSSLLPEYLKENDFFENSTYFVLYGGLNALFETLLCFKNPDKNIGNQLEEIGVLGVTQAKCLFTISVSIKLDEKRNLKYIGFRI